MSPATTVPGRGARGAGGRGDGGRGAGGRGDGGRATAPGAALPTPVALEVRAALQAGASPAAALGVVREGPLALAADATRMGRPLAAVAAETATGDRHADLLVRALALAERTGAGGLDAVEQVLAAADDDRHLDRLLRARTTQARLSARVLSLIPLALWVVLVAADRSMLVFYRTAPGVASAGVALALAAAGWWWARRIVARAGRAADDADPLAPPRPRPELARAAAAALPVLAVAGLMMGLMPAVALAGLVAAVAARGRARAATGGDGERAGGAETTELVAAALHAGLDVQAALAVIAPLAPPPARDALEQAVARLRAGWHLADAFEGTGLAELGAVLAATARWGAPAHGALRHLAAEIRARRRAAAEEAAERTQIALIFPTTLLTLPAFVAAVVPPLVWTAFAG